MESGKETRQSVEQSTGRVFGDLWHRYDDKLFKESVELWEKRWLANGEPPEFFRGKRCLDAGCGGGRYVIAMSMMGATSVVGVDVGEEGLADGRRRAAALECRGVDFKAASVLDLPFGDGEFDFACCSGVLHHTVGVERGLSELHRVLKPGGSLYLLLYGDGGLYWPLNLVLRAFAGALGYAEVDRCVQAAGLAANKRRTVLDDLFVPTLETYSRKRVDFMLGQAGFASWRRWGGGQFDQESDPVAMVKELEIREQLWRAGAVAAGAAEGPAKVERHLAEVCRQVIDAARELLAQHAAGKLTAPQLRDAIIGHGHHRVIAVKP